MVPGASDAGTADRDGGDEGSSRRGDGDRDESRDEQLDRNWDELLQELRVTQTGVQILTGFLLTLPFQQRFQSLSDFQHGVYLVTFVLAASATALIIAPVSFHRWLFRKHEKELLVRWGDRFARAGLVVLALAVGSVALLVFDVVVGRVQGITASVCAVGLYLTLWVALPAFLGRSAHASGPR
jgi:hypothetical protein